MLTPITTSKCTLNKFRRIYWVNLSACLSSPSEQVGSVGDTEAGDDSEHACDPSAQTHSWYRHSANVIEYDRRALAAEWLWPLPNTLLVANGRKPKGSSDIALQQLHPDYHIDVGQLQISNTRPHEIRLESVHQRKAHLSAYATDWRASLGIDE